MDHEVRRGGLVGPILLIGLGVIFLLNNLGITSVSLWDLLWKGWPVLLIVAGLDLLIGRRTALGGLMVALVVIAVVAGGVWLLSGDVGTRSSWDGEQVVQALDGFERAEVEIAQGAGVQQILADAEAADLVHGRIDRVRNETIHKSFELEGDTAVFDLDSRAVNWVGPFGRPFGQGGPTWDLTLSGDVPMDLKTSLGAGQVDLDLRDLTATDLDVSLGVGQITVLLPDAGEYRAEVSGAIGRIVIHVPEGLEARIEFGGPLGARDVPLDYTRRGDLYVSPGYDDAEDRVDLKVDLAIGAVEIR